MAGYAKSWTDKYNDEWYLSLSLAERGMWDQLRDWAKLHGDTGGIFLSNLTHAGAVFGCDRKTAGRILGKFRVDSKIELSITKTGVKINICKYEYYQRVKSVGKNSGAGSYRVNSPISRPEQSRPEQSNIVRQSTPDPIPYAEIVTDLNLQTKKKYPTNPVSEKTKGFIRARWNEGYQLDDFKYVHKVKTADWLGTKDEKYLRPETLYGNKFEGYRQQSRRTGNRDRLSLAGGHAEAGPVGSKR